MRDKIAIFSGGWSGEYLQSILSGAARLFNAENYDVITFVNFSVRGDIPRVNIPEVNLFKLPDLSEFAGVILLANSFNNDEEFRYLLSEINRTNIPAITIEYKLDNIPTVSTDNYLGMYILTNHLIEAHNCKKLVYIGGPKEHTENIERLNAFKSACSESGIDITDKEVYYADWSKSMIPNIIDDWLEKNASCPDVFVVANDIMAMTVCNYLKTIGLSVPEDVKVTGYDCTRLARTHSPSIASVSHEWEYMGEIAALRLNKMIKGEPDTADGKLSTVFVPGQSCGCDEVSIALAEKRVLSNLFNADRIDPIDSDSHFRHFYTSIKKAHTLQEVHGSYSYLFEHEHDVEGLSFSLFIDPEFFKFENQKQNLKLEGYNDEFTVLCQLRRGIAQPSKTCLRKDIFNEIIEKDNLPNLYVILPLYSEDSTYGFAALNGKLNVVNENQHYIWTRHMIQSLEFVANNLLLAEMNKQLVLSSVTDELSSIYNRTGAEKYIYPKLLEAAQDKKKSVIMLIDVDHMKIINDRFGHVNGDLAIKTVSNILKTKLPDGFIPCRFGGDEFLVGGIIDGDIDMDIIVKEIEDVLAQIVEKEHIEFPLTISIGYSIFTAKKNTDIEKAIVLADELMYATKRIHHDNFSLKA